MAKSRDPRVLAQMDPRRLRNTAARRRHVERLLERAQLLDEPDRLLIEAVYEHGLSVAAIARLRQRSPSCVYHKLKQLLARIRSPLFEYVAAHRDVLPIDIRRTAEAIALRGRTQRQTAALTRQSLHTVRRHMQAVRTLAEM